MGNFEECCIWELTPLGAKFRNNVKVVEAEYTARSHTGLKQKPRFAPPLILSVRVYFYAVSSHSYCYKT